MREIEFRGKLISSEKWAYGNLEIKKTGTAIITPDETVIGRYGQVDRNTVGQWTGLYDKNGVKIFEGDIVRYANKWNYMICIGEYNKNPNNCAEQIVVGVYLKSIEEKEEVDCICSIDGFGARFPKHCAESEEGTETFKLEIVGNIYDNRELLEKGE